MVAICLDQAAFERVGTGVKDAAALAQEYMIPHRPFDGLKDE
jgi:hypothetical protein